MKRLVLLLTILSLTSVLWAQFPTNESSKTLDIDNLSSGFNDFHFVWNGYEGQFISITLEQSDTGLDVANFYAQAQLDRFVVGATNVPVLTFTTNDITTATSNLTWSINYTNMPADGIYLLDIILTDTTNFRTVGRGKVDVRESLHD